MNRRARVLAALGLAALAVLGLEHPGLGVAFLLLAAFAALASAMPRRRSRHGAEAAAARGSPSPLAGVGRILVPVDFSPESASALEYARVFATRFRSQVFVLYVVSQPSVFPGRHAAEGVREGRWRARVEMQAFLRACGGHGGCQVVFASGTPFAAILDEAARLRADLIVLGTRGTGGVEASVMGRTASEVVRRAPVPVLTVAGRPEAAARPQDSRLASAA